MTIPSGRTDTSRQYLAEYEIFPAANTERFHTKLVEVYQEIALRVNERQIGTYDKVEVNAGQRFFGSTASAVKRDVKRTVYEISGPIAAGATSNTAHGLTNVNFYTNIYGTIQTATPDDRPLPYVDASAIGNQVSLTITGTNIVIVNGATAPQIDLAVVVLEYVKT
ncbi:MAG: hypothetical protein PVI43_01295 [Candidatus Bathyarchaeota archaeon]|jgi:hypothetical protein